MEMGISKPSTIQMGFEGHIPEKDLVVEVDLIILLEKGSVVGMEKPDAKTISWGDRKGEGGFWPTETSHLQVADRPESPEQNYSDY
jgi:hypothetical protein